MLGLRKRSRASIPTPAAGGVTLAVDSDGLLVLKKEDGSVVAPETLISELSSSSGTALASAVATLTTAIATKQDAATAATDTELAAEASARATADGLLLPKAGGAMTGALTLSGDPTANLHPATRQWTAAQIAALINGAPEALDTLKEISDRLGLDEAAESALIATVATKLAKASNLSDLADAVAARGNLGLGTAATHPSTDFDVAGSAATEETRAKAAEASVKGEVKTEKERAETAEALKLAKAEAGTVVVNGGSLGATPTLALAGSTRVFLYSGTLTANCALTISGLAAGASGTLALQQDAVGGRSLTVNGTSVSIPTGPQVYFAVEFYSPDGTTLLLVPPAPNFTSARTYAVSGAIAVPSGGANYLPPFDEPVDGGVAKSLVKVIYSIRGGTSVTFAVTRNGATIGGLGALSATTASASTAPSAATAVSDGDVFAVVVSAVSGAPDGLKVTFIFETVL